MVSTQGLAAASARHPWRTIGAWAVAALLAMVAIGALLGGSLTTEGRPTNDPQSFRAEDVRDPGVERVLDRFQVIGLPTYVVLMPVGAAGAPD